MKNLKESSPSTSQMRPAKKVAFRVILVLFPILFLVLLEVSLRLVNYGGTLDVFVPGPGPLRDFYICNRDIARRYFAGSDILPTPANDYFRQQKPANGFRIFVLGGSTANGYPYGSNLMFSRLLEQRLKKMLPNRVVEVVNVSTAAINSYALLDVMDEVLAQEADLILIYAGHNEYYGALGVASMINIGRTPAFVRFYLKLARFKTFRLIRDSVQFLQKKTENTAPTATLMQRIVATHSIPLNSPLYQKGVEQFSGNLKRILKKAARANVPIFVSELVSNTSDVPPFISVDETESAHETFERAKKEEQAGLFQNAAIDFTKAKDLDGLRFRAPSEFNQIIHSLADQFDAVVVPMLSVFESASPNGLVGDNLMIDHLHPNIDGYFLMAEAFLHKMLESGFLPAAKPHTLDTMLRSSYTPLDSLYGALNILVLKSGWPFQPNPASIAVLDSFQATNEMEKMAQQAAKYDNVSIQQAHEKLATYFEDIGDQVSALAEYQALVALKTMSAKPYLKVSEARIKAEQLEGVPDLLNEALLFDTSPLPYIMLGEALNGLGRYPEAIVAFEQAQRVGAPPNDPHVVLGLSFAYQQSGQLDKLQKLQREHGSSTASMQQADGDAQLYQLLQYADQLIQADEFDRALIELQTSLTIRETSQAHTWIGQIYMEKEQLDLAVIHLEKARALGSTDPLMLYNLCVALYQQQEYKRARDILLEVKKQAPNFGDPYDLQQKIEKLLN